MFPEVPLDLPSSPYDSPFTMSSFHGLEQVAGIKIVTILSEIHGKVMSAAGVVLNKSQQKKLKKCETNTERLEVIIGQWESGNSDIPPTWESLLSILDTLQLNELKQQVKNVFGE